jgi:subtilisin family serine protease
MKNLRILSSFLLAASVASLASFQTVQSAPGRINPELLRKLRANPNASFDVILRFDRVAPPRGASRAEVIRALQGDLGVELKQVNAVISSYGLKLVADTKDTLWLDSSVLVRLPGKAIEVIGAISSVDVIFENFTVRIPKVMAQSTSSAPAGTPWHLDRVGAPQAWAAGFKGAGVRVGHLDTGIDASHPELAGRLEAFAEFDAKGDRVAGAKVHDTGNHGTHTAGLIAGSRVGVAPDSKLLSALVLPDGAGTFAQVIAGMQWVLDPDGNPATDDGAKIVSMSLGLPGNVTEFAEPTANLIRAGVVPVFAAGNFGPNAGTISSPGNLQEPITVGAIDSRNALAAFSSRGPVNIGGSSYTKPDVLAPGVNVTSLAPNGTYISLTGTSQAAPVVAGIAALLRSAKPSADWQTVKNAILSGARGSGDANAVGRGVAFAPGALEALGLNVAAKPDPQPAPTETKPDPKPEPKPADPKPTEPAKPIPSQTNNLPLLREVTNIPDNGQLRGVLDPGPQAVVNGKITSLEFRLVNANGQVVYKQLEKEAPFCIAGGEGDRCAPFDTRKLGDGAYTLALVATLTNGRTQEFRAKLTINNSGTNNSGGNNGPDSSPAQNPAPQTSNQNMTLKASGMDGAIKGQDANASGGQAFFLNSKGDLARFTTPENLRAGRYNISIRARGQNYKGWPEVELRINGKTIGKTQINSNGFVKRGFGTFDLQPGQQLEVVFLNDEYGGKPDKDRNVILDALLLEPA